MTSRLGHATKKAAARAAALFHVGSNASVFRDDRFRRDAARSGSSADADDVERHAQPFHVRRHGVNDAAVAGSV